MSDPAENGDLGWPPGAATGVGSMPGDDVVEAARFVLDELPDLPHVPELPARGPWAGMVGRTGAVLVDLPLTLETSGWRLAARPGSDDRRAGTLLASDLDLFAGLAAGYTGTVKTQVTGPWTMAATVGTPRGAPVLTDPGAVRDLVASLAEGVAAHVSEVRRRLPDARVLVQLDEPALPSVLAGSVPTVSGLGRLPAVPAPEATAALASVVGATPAPVTVHCCANRVPVLLVRDAGASAVSLDLALLADRDADALAEAHESGLAFFAGVVPATDADLSDLDATVARVRQWWRGLGLEPKVMAEAVVPTPSCGLAGASPSYVRVALRRCREVARVLAESPEGA